MYRSIQILAAALAPFALAGCVSAQKPLAEDYGLSVRQNITAQIADPEARYTRTEAPASDGSRAVLAQRRYVKGDVLQPVAQGTTDIEASATGAGAGGTGQSGGK